MLVNRFKLGRVLPKILKVMEDEQLNLAEAEKIPGLLEETIRKNSELHKKGEQFTVHQSLFHEL